jgi:hypothetical protein
MKSIADKQHIDNHTEKNKHTQMFSLFVIYKDKSFLFLSKTNQIHNMTGKSVTNKITIPYTKKKKRKRRNHS